MLHLVVGCGHQIECCQGSIADLMKIGNISVRESVINSILRDILTSLTILHEKKIVHIDIKPGSLS